MIKRIGVFSVFLFFTTIGQLQATFSFEENEALPIVYFNIVVNAGSANDPKDKLGLTNMTYQMLLRGTQKRSKVEFDEALDNIGGRLGVDVRTEGTVFRGAVLSENLKPFLDLVYEALTSPRFAAVETAKIKKEIESEILDNRSNDKYLATYHFQRFFYSGHPYANPIVGTLSGIKKITALDMVEHFANTMGGSNLAFFGTGLADESILKEWFTLLSEKLVALHPEALTADDLIVKKAPMPHAGRRLLLVNKPGATQSQILLGGIGPTPETNGYYALELANHSFGGASFQARLMQELRVKRGWTYGAYSSFQYGQQPRHYALYFFPKTADTRPAIELAISLFEDYLKKGISAEEFSFSKSALVNNAPFNYDTAKKRVENATTEHLTLLPRGYFKNYAGNIDDVKSGSVTEALQGFFNPGNLTAVVVGDAAKLKKELTKISGFSEIEVKDYRQE